MNSNRKIFLSLLMLLSAMEVVSQPFNYLWAVELGGRPSYSGRIQAVYNDYGYIYMTGDFQNSQTFGNITLNPEGYQDAYIAIYDTAGQFLFARRWGAPFSYAYAGSIALDHFGYIYVAGRFINQCTIDGQTVNSAGSDDIFLAKLDPLGNVVWLVRAGGSLSDEVSSICYYNNTIFMTGSFTSLATFGTINLTSSGVNDRDIFIAAFNINFGNVTWAVKAGGSGEDRGKCIRVDNAGNLILCGLFNNTAFFGSNSVTSQQAGDAFIAKYSTSGQNQWVRSGGSGGNDFAESVGVDQNNNYYITGFINNTATFGTFTVSDNGYGNAFIAKYNSAGTVQWAKGGGSSSSDYAYDIAVYPTGHSYITGYMNGTANFSGVTIPAIGSHDVFIVHYNSSGGVIFGTAIGGQSQDQGKSILCNEGGGIIYIMGEYSLSVNFGNITLTAPQGTWRQFLTRLSSGTLSVIEPATHLLQLNYDEMTNMLTVAFPEKVRGQAILSVTDMQGRTVFETTLFSLLAGEVKTLTLPDLNKGIYRAILHHPHGQYSASFVKTH